MSGHQRGLEVICSICNNRREQFLTVLICSTANVRISTAKKLKLEDNEAASEDKEIVPDLDDPHMPTWVWDWLLEDGKITEAERHLVAQHEDEAGGNLCVKCGVDMGADNPRQYCGKNMCLGLGFE